MISNIVLGVSLVILLCVVSEKISYKIGVPALIFFMFIGMFFGSDGPLHIQYFNYSNFSSAEMICSIGLIFIMKKQKVRRKTIKLSGLIVLLCLKQVFRLSGHLIDLDHVFL